MSTPKNLGEAKKKMRARILIVDDDPDTVFALENRVIWMGHEPLIARDGKEALRLIQQEQPDLVLLDVILPVLSGFEVLQQLNDAARTSLPTEAVSVHGPPVIILTGFGTIKRAVEAMELGAVDFITKPFTGDAITVAINKALEAISLRRQVGLLREEMGSRYDYDQIVKVYPTMAAQLAIAKQAAAPNETVLLLGGTDIEKELVARAIHQWSSWRSKAFIAVKCALPEKLLASGLLGNEHLAFTGTVKTAIGKIEMAEGGTLFLDEISEMPYPLQDRLLLVLQNQKYYRIGGTKEVQSNVRFIAATNRDLRQMVRDGTFKEDLFFRLAAITITLPPLQDR